jgi:hypothetical protein
MANWSNPGLASTYTNFLNDLKARDEDLAKQFDGQTTSNLPVGTIRWSSSINRWQKWSGTAWDPLTTTYALTGLSTTGNAAIGGTLSVTGVSQLAAGTAAAPGLGIGEASTGLFRPGAGILGFTTAGTEVFRADGQRMGFGYSGSLGGANGAYRFATPPSGGTGAIGISYSPEIAADVTSNCNVLRLLPSTADGIASLTDLRYFIAAQGTITGGTRGTVVNQYGFFANSNLADATNNYGFFSQLSNVANRWNFYASTAAPNYFAGSVRTGMAFSENTPVTANQTNNHTMAAGTLLGGIRTSTPLADINMQLPTATNMDNAMTSLQVDQGFEWTMINLATAASTWDVTITANTSHTVVGNMRVTGETSGRFKTVKTAAAPSLAFVTYRIS